MHTQDQGAERLYSYCTNTCMRLYYVVTLHQMRITARQPPARHSTLSMPYTSRLAANILQIHEGICYTSICHSGSWSCTAQERAYNAFPISPLLSMLLPK